LPGLRLTIESVFSNLKEQMRLERHLAKTPRGLAQRITQRLLALTLGISSTPSPYRVAEADPALLRGPGRGIDRGAR
jgi:hypothetical protein